MTHVNFRRCIVVGAAVLLTSAVFHRTSIGFAPPGSTPDRGSRQNAEDANSEPDSNVTRRLVTLLETLFKNQPAEPGIGAQCHYLELYLKFRPNDVPWLTYDDDLLTSIQLQPKALVETWRGIEVRSPETELRGEHRNQILYFLGKLGAQPSCRVVSGQMETSVAELVRNATMEFHLKQEEIAWTVSAFCYYQEGTVWTNRFGEEYTFDDLANEIMRRPLNQESCAGFHLVAALTHILTRDRSTPVLSEQVRHSSREYIRQRVSDLENVDTQIQYAWSPDRFSTKYFVGSGSTHDELIVLGHLLMWLECLPETLQPTEKTRARLRTQALARVLELSPEDLTPAELCPMTHVLTSVLPERQ